MKKKGFQYSKLTRTFLITTLMQGALKVDGEKIASTTASLEKGEYVIQVGKRKFAKVFLS